MQQKELRHKLIQGNEFLLDNNFLNLTINKIKICKVALLFFKM